MWGYSPSGEFDQKTAYAIARGDSGLAARFERDWVWKVDSMPRIKCLLWKICDRSIPVKEVLYGRGITQDAQCCVCNNERESIIHAIRDYSFAKSVWDNFRDASGIQEFYSLDLIPWLKINLNFQSHRSGLMPWKVEIDAKDSIQSYTSDQAQSLLSGSQLVR
nr:putative ribonuclease h protein [Quercus suber]